ncbi:MAG TPA: DUF5683 domain-containing protein [Saprospiraceae bacterium]|nr:DUF5683 domain-containing protein [Saprospiraceae bacterium]
MKWILQLVLLSFFVIPLFAQDGLTLASNSEIQADSAKLANPLRIKDKSPNRAAIYSLVLPGAGQVYNGRIWKVPIVYAALGTSFYFIRTNKTQYRRFRDAYLIRIDTIPTTFDEFVDVIPTAEGIKSYRDQARRYMEISYFSFGFVWLLNSIEAYVDCHLLHFDISEDLSLDLSVPKAYPGISVNLSFNKVPRPAAGRRIGPFGK